MVTTIEALIEQALLTAAQALTMPTGVTMVLEGQTITITATTKYVHCDVQFVRSIETDLSNELDPIRQGYVRFNVMWPRNYAKIDATELAGKIRKAFKRGSKKTNGNVVVRFDEDPELFAQPLMKEDTHRTISVTCRWRSYP